MDCAKQLWTRDFNAACCYYVWGMPNVTSAPAMSHKELGCICSCHTVLGCLLITLIIEDYRLPLENVYLHPAFPKPPISSAVMLYLPCCWGCENRFCMLFHALSWKQRATIIESNARVLCFAGKVCATSLLGTQAIYKLCCWLPQPAISGKAGKENIGPTGSDSQLGQGNFPTGAVELTN